tara:strand:- start:41 stop:454 length:414 start_codon:yes stop_codon:yes gene_type:complete
MRLKLTIEDLVDLDTTYSQKVKESFYNCIFGYDNDDDWNYCRVKQARRDFKMASKEFDLLLRIRSQVEEMEKIRKSNLSHFIKDLQRFSEEIKSQKLIYNKEIKAWENDHGKLWLNDEAYDNWLKRDLSEEEWEGLA